MIDPIVQFVRNFLCCIKDWKILSDSWLYDANVTAQYYDLPEPMNQTTPLEAMISTVQLYVVWSGVPESWKLFWMSYGKLNRIYRLMKKTQQSLVKNDADRLINASLKKEAVMALRSMFVGFNVFFISISFVWLAANSWHITETDWVGGLPALIHALTVMNVGLMPLLYYMYKDGNEQFVKARHMKAFSDKLKRGQVSQADIQLSTFEAMTGWLPFWDSGVGLFDVIDTEKEVKLMNAESSKVQKMLDSITGSDKQESVVRTGLQKQQAIELDRIVRVTRLEGYREYLYLILNFIAWYGYGMCIVVYYWPDELKQPHWMRIDMLQLENIDADWRGNFAGDLMWTIEPIIVLASPLYLSAVRKSTDGKVKAKTE
jgi:hypothetical protein